MKYILSSVSFIALVFCFFCSTTSCKKSSSSPTDTATLYLHLHTDIDSVEVDSLGKLYPDGNGRYIGLTNASFYITNVALTNIDGSVYNLPGIYVLKTIGTETYMVGTIPSGSFTSISFNVGVDGATNTQSGPANYTAPNPLAAQTPSMWFNSTNGYVFMSIQGTAKDTSTAPVVPINYLIGSTSNTSLPTVTLPIHSPVYTVGNKQALTIHLICDYGKLLSVVTSFNSTAAPSNDSTNTFTVNPTLAKTISTNIPNMFYYEQ